MNETQIKIIEAAEVEFAEMGYDGASIREITQRAGVNIAAINYHFGSKEALFKEMVLYRIRPINRIRIEILETALEQNEGTALPLEQVVGIIIRPLFAHHISSDSSDFRYMRSIGKSFCEERDFMKDLHKEALKEVFEKFSSAISDSLGNPDFAKIAYGMHFLSCAIVGSMMQHTRLEFVSKGALDVNDVEALVDHLVAFVAGGLKAISEVPTRNPQ